MKPKIITPHDMFFRKAMQDLVVAKSFFEQHLSEKVKAYIDLSTLALSNEILIDENFEKRFPDAIYTVKIGDHTSYLYPLIEHLSSAKKICREVFKKKVRLMERHCVMYNTDVLPLVHVLVLYHGVKEYPHSTEICDYIGGPRELSQDNLQSQLQLIDLNTISDEQLQQHFQAGALQYALKHIRAQNIVDVLREFSSWLIDLESENSNLVKDLVYYLARVGKIQDLEEFKSLIYQELPQTGDTMTTAFEHERQQGRVLGSEETSLKIAKRLLTQKHLPIDDIAHLTDLDPETIRNLGREDEVNEER